MNYLWAFMILIGIVYAAFNGTRLMRDEVIRKSPPGIR